MVRTYKFEVGPVVEQLDRILQMELAGVVYYTHYSFMVYGHARIPITSWLRDNASESLTHAQEAGEMIMRLHKRPTLGIEALPITRRNTIDEIITEAVQREEAGVELYRELLSLVKEQIRRAGGICDPHGRSGGGTHPGNGAYVDEARTRLSLSYFSAQLASSEPRR
jgi:bacterioferritin